ncbi:MAG: hypothetical protein JJT81_13420 [Rubellimicrobium sp.]|nr:hypothetical protein [Rubellimicrobium sp.]
MVPVEPSFIDLFPVAGEAGILAFGALAAQALPAMLLLAIVGLPLYFGPI